MQFWKNEREKLVKIDHDTGFNDMDWEVNLTTASKYIANTNDMRCTMMIRPK
jgi:hypothetical protein